MSNLIVSIYSVMLASFFVSSYFLNVNNDTDIKYERKNLFELSFFIYVIASINLLIGLIIDSIVYINISILIMTILIVKEIIISCVKLSYFNKKFKIILRNSDYNINVKKIKKIMEIESIRNLIYLLASPLLVIKFIVNKILEITYE